MLQLEYFITLSTISKISTIIYIFRWVNSLRPQSADGLARARPSSAGYSSQTAKHIPYRNSLLTMVLRDSLGKTGIYYYR